MPIVDVKIKFSGNIYANIINEPGYPPNYDVDSKDFYSGEYELFKGQVYDKGLNYSDYMLS